MLPEHAYIFGFQAAANSQKDQISWNLIVAMAVLITFL